MLREETRFGGFEDVEGRAGRGLISSNQKRSPSTRKSALFKPTSDVAPTIH